LGFATKRAAQVSVRVVAPPIHVFLNNAIWAQESPFRFPK